MTWLVVGLGNPGRKYAGHRHNLGFMVLEELARRSAASFRRRFQGRFDRTELVGTDTVLLEPHTMMNRSGTAVAKAATFFGIPPERTLVIHDDMDLSFGTVRVKKGGGHGGHNGLRSLFQHFGRSFVRLRGGVGRPGGGEPTGYLLNDFDREQRRLLPELLAELADVAECVLRDGPDGAMNAYNGRPPVGGAG